MLKRTYLWQSLKSRYRRLPARRKLSLTTLVGSSVSAVFAGTVLFLFQVFVLRKDFEAQIEVLSQMITEQSASALAFDDKEALRTIAGSTMKRSDMRSFRVMSLDGMTAVTLGEHDWTPRPNEEDEPYYVERSGWHLHVAKELDLDGKPIGYLYLDADFFPILVGALRVFLPALTGIVIISALIGGAVTALISRLFFRDLEMFTHLSREIADTSNFGLRARIQGEDEFATMGLAFNRMLDRLQESEAQLRATNDSLAAEIVARERAEGQLLESSRLAGMAQVATGVLHNVGNVLNSVNVSVQILQDTLATHPRFALLQQTTALMRAQGEKLPQFLAEDAKGRLVPRLIMELGDQLALIQKEMIKETQSLAQNIDHIKQIVAMQQGYAKGGGVLQSVKPAELFEETVRIAQASLRRHGVTLKKQMAEGAPVVTDRHQVLQILVNFVTNATQAVKGCPAGERTVVLHVHYTTLTVRFGVVDNGVGIAPENLQKIFQHGFTTRKDGHGFGLHSGALAARNLGGTVTMESAGVGQGATFWLELPLNPVNSASTTEVMPRSVPTDSVPDKVPVPLR